MLLAVRISSSGCTWEVWRALKKLEFLSAIASSNSYASFVLSKPSECIHNSIYTHAKHEPIRKLTRDAILLLLLLHYSKNKRYNKEKKRHIKESHIYRAINYSIEAVSLVKENLHIVHSSKERSRSFNNRSILYHSCWNAFLCSCNNSFQSYI